MTPQQIRLELDICRKATKGPWKWTAGVGLGPQLEGAVEYAEMSPIIVSSGCHNGCIPSLGGDHLRHCPLHPARADREFIEHARTGYPKALRGLIRQATTIANLKKQLKNTRSRGTQAGEIETRNMPRLSSEDEADAAVIKILKTRAAPMSPTEVQSALREAKIPETAGRIAVLRLAEEGQILIREDRRIELITYAHYGRKDE